jgi:hypothetical protein
MTAVVWALPSKVVLVGAIMAGNGLLAAAFAVALSAVRLTPMVVALVPEMRTPGRAAGCSISCPISWPSPPGCWRSKRCATCREARRTAYYGGLGSTLIFLNMCVVTAVYLVARDLPPAASAALLLITPIYFLTSLWGSAREKAGHVAMVLGLVLGPIIHLFAPGASLLATGPSRASPPMAGMSGPRRTA